jgi:hypothetical protein
MSKPQK